MTETSPRPCLHTTVAILGVLLVGLMLGGFSRGPAPQSSDGSAQVSVKAAASH